MLQCTTVYILIAARWRRVLLYFVLIALRNSICQTRLSSSWPEAFGNTVSVIVIHRLCSVSTCLLAHNLVNIIPDMPKIPKSPLEDPSTVELHKYNTLWARPQKRPNKTNIQLTKTKDADFIRANLPRCIWTTPVK